MAAKVEVQKISSGDPEERFWHLKDSNGEIVATGESYANLSNTQRGVNNVAREFAILFLEAVVGDRGASSPAHGVLESLKQGRYDDVDVSIVER